MSERAIWRQGQETWLPPIIVDMHPNPAKTALMIVDMQHSDAHRDYGLGRMYAQMRPPGELDYYFSRLEELVVPNTVKLLEFFRKHKLRIIFVCVGALSADYSDIGFRRQERDRRNFETYQARIFYHQSEFEYSLLPELGRRPDELILHKSTGGLFNSSGADQLLRGMGVENLVITGVITNGCVENTARDAADRGYKCILVEDACATFDEQVHHASLRNFACICGNVKTADETISVLAERLV